MSFALLIRLLCKWPFILCEYPEVRAWWVGSSHHCCCFSGRFPLNGVAVCVHAAHTPPVNTPCDSAPSFCSCIPGSNPDSAPWPEARPRSHRRPCRRRMHAERSSVWAAALAESGRAERGSSVGWRRQKWSLQLFFFFCSCWFGQSAGNTQALSVQKQNVFSLSCCS